MKIKALLIALVATLTLSAGCSYSQEVKDYSAGMTPIHSAVLSQSIVLLQHYKSIVEEYADRMRAEEPDKEVMIQMTNPLYDEDDPDSEEFIYVKVEDYLEEIQYNIDKLVSLAEAQEILNHSIQEDRGLEPLLEGIKEVMSDEELIELIRRYGPLILGSNTE